MAGSCHTMKEESNVSLREHVLDYITALLEDANNLSRAVANARNALLLCCIEQGEISISRVFFKKLTGSVRPMLKNIPMLVKMPVVLQIL